MAPPEFPSTSVIERTRSLGFGSGPWERERLVAWMGEASADKYVTEAKAAGWLVSPYRGTYYIPAAQDLSIVPWLPEPARSEFLISRTLTTAGLPYWCLSAWSREQGLELGKPLFVTDLGVRDALARPRGSKPANRKTLFEKARNLARGQRPLPFLEELVIVPLLPPGSGEPQLRAALVPEAPNIEAQRRKQKMVGEAAVSLVSLALMVATKTAVPVQKGFDEVASLEVRARGIRYAVGPDLRDSAWIVALLASLGTPRIEELVSTLLRAKPSPDAAAVQGWASLFGPPQPNGRWKDALEKGPYPYLLVPPALWSEMGADQAARRYRMLDTLRA